MPTPQEDTRAVHKDRAFDALIKAAYHNELMAYVTWDDLSQKAKRDLAALFEHEPLPRPWLAQISQQDIRTAINELEKAGLYDGSFLAERFLNAREILEAAS